MSVPHALDQEKIVTHRLFVRDSDIAEAFRMSYQTHYPHYLGIL